MYKQLIKTDSILTKSVARYEFNEYTTEYGAIVFNDVKGGDISNCNIFHAGYNDFGHIDFYIDKKTGTLKSIWFVSLKSETLIEDNQLSLSWNEDYEVPVFDLSIWDENKENLWPRLNAEKPIEVCFNREGVLYITFGENNLMQAINDNILFQYDINKALTGIVIKNQADLTRLIASRL